MSGETIDTVIRHLKGIIAALEKEKAVKEEIARIERVTRMITMK